MNMQMTRKTGSLLLILSMIIILVSCSGTNTDVTTPSADTSITTEMSSTTSSSEVIESTTSSEIKTTTTTAATTAVTTAATTTAKTEATQKTFTLTQLAKYNGLNGQPAYVAVDGIVYDVSKIKQWSGGTHEGYEAGTDLTDLMSSAPHSADVLSKAVIVGVLVP